MKRYFLLTFLLSTATFANPISDLTSEDYSRIKSASRTLTIYPSEIQDVNDILASVIHENHKVISPIAVDAISWAAKAIAETRDSRYSAIITESYYNAESQKLKKYLKHAAEKLDQKSTTQYRHETSIKTTIMEKYQSVDDVRFLIEPPKNCIFISQKVCRANLFTRTHPCNEWHKYNAYSQMANTVFLINKFAVHASKDSYADYYHCAKETHKISTTTTLEERLDALRMLYESGTIDQSTMEIKRAEILNEI